MRHSSSIFNPFTIFVPLPSVVSLYTIIFVILLLFIILPQEFCLGKEAWAEGGRITSYFESGEKTTTEVIDEKDDLDYCYQRYYLRYQQKLSRGLDFAAGYWQEEKNFLEEEELSSRAGNFSGRLNYLLRSEKDRSGDGRSLRLNLGTKYYFREYPLQEENTYYRSGLEGGATYTRMVQNQRQWQMALFGGISTYHYPASSDKIRSFQKLEIETSPLRQISLGGFVKWEQTDYQEDKDSTEISWDLNSRLQPGFPLLSEISLRYEEGIKSVEEEQEEIESEEMEAEEQKEVLSGDFYYWFSRWQVRTEHSLLPRLTTGFSYSREVKDYQDRPYDRSGYRGDNYWRIILKKSPGRETHLRLRGGYEEKFYSLIPSLTRYQNEVGIELAHTVRLHYSLALNLEGYYYRYPEALEKDRNTYSVTLEAGRYFRPSLHLAGRFTFRWKDYLYAADTFQPSFRLALISSF